MRLSRSRTLPNVVGVWRRRKHGCIMAYLEAAKCCRPHLVITDHPANATWLLTPGFVARRLPLEMC